MPIYAIIISQKLATYNELKKSLYYEDALDLLEIINVDSYNNYILDERAKLEAKYES